MTGWQDPTFETDLRRLLLHVRKAAPGALVNATALDHSKILRFGMSGVPPYVIEGEDLVLLRSLRQRMIGSSRHRFGMSEGEAERLLHVSCEQALTGTIKTAVANLVAALQVPGQDWIVGQSLGSAIRLNPAKLRVGRTIYSHTAPRRLVTPRQLERNKALGFELPVATTVVHARDSDTAEALAQEAFAESAAILDLSSKRIRQREYPTLVSSAHGTRAALPSVRWMVHPDLFEPDGRLISPYRELSLAASRAEGKRSDWQRRVLAATRWFSRSWRNEWPADRLASIMVALECLFVEGRKENAKGALISERLSKRYRLREFTDAEQVTWISSLYGARNDAVHEGRQLVDDLDIDRLVEVAQAIIRLSAWHLVSNHSPRGRACRTFAEAMACSAP